MGSEKPGSYTSPVNWANFEGNFIVVGLVPFLPITEIEEEEELKSKNAKMKTLPSLTFAHLLCFRVHVHSGYDY